MAINYTEWKENEFRGKSFVCDCEHEGDIEYMISEISNAGGIIDGYSWDGEDCGEAWVYYHCNSKNTLNRIKNMFEY